MSFYMTSFLALYKKNSVRLQQNRMMGLAIKPITESANIRGAYRNSTEATTGLSKIFIFIFVIDIFDVYISSLSTVDVRILKINTQSKERPKSIL